VKHEGIQSCGRRGVFGILVSTDRKSVVGGQELKHWEIGSPISVGKEKLRRDAKGKGRGGKCFRLGCGRVRVWSRKSGRVERKVLSRSQNDNHWKGREAR